MSILDTVRAHGRHRLSAAELRDENRLLLAREVAASDFFALLIEDRDRVHAAWQHEKQKAADAELVVVQQQADLETAHERINELRAQLANLQAVTVPPMERDTSDGADQATQPIDVRELQARFAAGPVVSLHHSPLADSGN